MPNTADFLSTRVRTPSRLCAMRGASGWKAPSVPDAGLASYPAPARAGSVTSTAPRLCASVTLATGARSVRRYVRVCLLEFVIVSIIIIVIFVCLVGWLVLCVCV